MAHYSAASEIAIRMLAARARVIDRAFFLERIAEAREHRQRVVHDSDAYRLISSEADGLPALIVDRYAGWLVLQALNQGMDRAQPMLVGILREMFPGDGIYERNEAAIRRLEKLPARAQVLAGEGEPRTEITFNGL